MKKTDVARLATATDEDTRRMRKNGPPAAMMKKKYNSG